MNRANVSIRGGAGPLRKAIPGVPYWFEYFGLAESSRLISGAESSTTVVDDAVFSNSVSGTSAKDFTPITTGTQPSVSLVSGDSVSIDEGVIQSIGEGDSTVRLETDGRTVDVTVTAAYVEDGATSTLKEWSSGTLAKAMSDNIDAALAAVTDAAAQKPVFSTQSHGAASYTRNASLWCADVAAKLTCCSPWNSTGSNTRAGALITDRHIVLSQHYPIADGATVRFVGPDNTVYDYTLLKSAHAGGDFRVGVLAQSVNAAIHRVPVMPSFSGRLPNIAQQLPAIMLDQEEKALCGCIYAQPSDYLSYKKPTGPDRLAMYEAIIGGDSGNPTFAWVGDDIVLMSVWHYSNYSNLSSGPFTGYYAANLNAAIAAADAKAGISTGLTITEYDLSGYPTY